MINISSLPWTNKQGETQGGQCFRVFFKSPGWFEVTVLSLVSDHSTRRKAKCVLRYWTGVALHAWTYRQLHCWVWNNGEEIKKQSTRNSPPFAICLSWEALGGPSPSHDPTQDATSQWIQGPSAVNGGTLLPLGYAMAKHLALVNFQQHFGSAVLLEDSQLLDSFAWRSEVESSAPGWRRTPKESANFCPSSHENGPNGLQSPRHGDTLWPLGLTLLLKGTGNWLCPDHKAQRQFCM